MPELTLTTRDGGTTSISSDAVDAFTGSVSGSVLTAASPGYDEARSIWNAMIDRRPGVIVECAAAEDVVQAVNFAREHNLLVAVRGGGHNIAGSAVCDGGIMISLATMKGITVDQETRRANVGPGATLGDLDQATQAHGLATPVGINSTTGVAGLTLGGGFGWLSRKHGLTIDNLVTAEMVTPSGDVVRASSDENADLFWAIRGGGGNFGIVTEFEYALHPVGPEVLAGLIVHPFSAAQEVLTQYRELAAQAPDELTVWVVMRKAPPLPFLPEDVHGTNVLVLAALYAGDIAEGEKVLAPLRAVGKPIADVIGPSPYAEFQTAFDPLLTPGARNYWKSHDFLELSDGLLDALIEQVEAIPDPQCEIFIAQMGGATNRVPADATAYRHRDANFIMNVHGRWDDAAKDNDVIGWCRAAFDAATPFATGGVYVNFMTEEESERVASAYGESHERLAKIKAQFDPDNMLRLNQNIRPA